jgi:hypothetical protein
MSSPICSPLPLGLYVHPSLLRLSQNAPKLLALRPPPSHAPPSHAAVIPGAT